MIVHHGDARPQRRARGPGRAASTTRLQVDGRRSARGRSAARCPPAAVAQDAARNSSLVATRSWARVRTRSGSHDDDVRAGRAAGRAAAPSRRRAPGPATPCPRRRCPRRSCRSMSATPGCSVGQRGGAGADGVGEQQLAARRRPQARARRPPALRWSATANQRISSTVSPQNSTRSGCSSVGREDVEDAAADGELAAPLDQVDAGVGGGGERARRSSSRSASSPGRSATGSRSPSPATSGCSTARTGATTHAERAAVAVGVAGARAGAARRAAGRRCRSAGESRSCGSVSQAGNSATACSGRKQRERGGEVLGLPAGGGDERTGRPAPSGAGAARAAARNGRTPAGATTSSWAGPGAGRVDHRGEAGVGADGVEQAGEAHGRAQVPSTDRHSARGAPGGRRQSTPRGSRAHPPDAVTGCPRTADRSSWRCSTRPGR